MFFFLLEKKSCFKSGHYRLPARPSNSCWVYWAGPMLSWVRQKSILLVWAARLAFNRLVWLLKDVFQSSFAAKIGCGDWIDFFLQKKIQVWVWKFILKPGLHESQSTPKQVRRLQWSGAFSRNWKFWLLKWQFKLKVSYVAIFSLILWNPEVIMVLIFLNSKWMEKFDLAHFLYKLPTVSPCILCSVWEGFCQKNKL